MDTQDPRKKDRYKMSISFQLDDEDDRRALELLMTRSGTRRQNVVRALLIAYGGEEPAAAAIQQEIGLPREAAAASPKIAKDQGGRRAASVNSAVDWTAEPVSPSGADTLRIAF